MFDTCQCLSWPSFLEHPGFLGIWTVCLKGISLVEQYFLGTKLHLCKPWFTLSIWEPKSDPF